MIIWKTDGFFYYEHLKKRHIFQLHLFQPFLSLFFFLSCDKKNLSPEKCVYVSEVLDTLLITARDVGGVRREMNLISLSGLNCCKWIWVKTSAMILLTAAFMIDVFTAPVFKRIISGFIRNGSFLAATLISRLTG